MAGLRHPSLPLLPTLQDLELVVYLQEFESTASPPAFLLCFSIVYVAFVFGGATHGNAKIAGYIRASGRPSKAVHSACSASQGSLIELVEGLLDGRDSNTCWRLQEELVFLLHDLLIRIPRWTARLIGPVLLSDN